MTRCGRALVIGWVRALNIWLLMLAPSFIVTGPLTAYAEEDSETKGDVSTENDPTLGQLKEQKVVQEEKSTNRPGSKKEPGAAPDRPANIGRGEIRPERPQRVERPLRPERPHR